MVGSLTWIIAKICSGLDGKEKLLFLKSNSLQKHACRQKCKITILGLTMGQYFMFMNIQHAKNEWLWANKGQNAIAKMVIVSNEAIEKSVSSYSRF